MSFYLAGLGTAVPPHAIEQNDAAIMAGQTYCAGVQQASALTKLYRRTGVNTRHCVILQSSTNGSPARQIFFAPASSSNMFGPTTGKRMQAYESDAAELATRAARQALTDAGMDGSEITHLVTASCTGFHAPGVDLALCEHLRLAKDVARTHVGFMGCHAALNALRVASAFASSDPTCCVLVCAVELCSLHFQYANENQHAVSNALFADGAAAIVGRGPRREYGLGTVIDTYSHRLENTGNLMSWRVGDHGFEMHLSPRVPSVIRKHLRSLLVEWLAKHSLAIEDIEGWAIHPGGPRILDACGEALGLSANALDPSRKVLSRYGNMSSPTVLFVLDEIRKSILGNHYVMLAFGPGLAIEGALIES